MPRARWPASTAAATPSGRSSSTPAWTSSTSTPSITARPSRSIPDAVKAAPGGGQGAGVGRGAHEQREDQVADGGDAWSRTSIGWWSTSPRPPGIDRELIVRQALITPSCGTGSLPVAGCRARLRPARRDQPGAARSGLGVA